MPTITKVIARITVEDLDSAVGFYQALAGTAEVQRFTFGGVSLASVGPFLLLSGPDATKVSDRVATLVVTDLDEVLAELARAGGRVREGPTDSPNGRRVIAVHPDGAVFEYIEQA
ncbi:VOC family protein [Amycolatopsis japonica]|uniref:VOC family protein n=1 Tax=Amycolatopsis japonica TaxID=208439 RepID=UPI00366FD796